MTRRATSMDRITLAVLAGSAAGGGSVALWLLVVGAAGIGEVTLQGVLAGLVMTTVAFTYVSAIWGVGIVLLGGPVWFALHLMKLTSPLAATATGGLMAWGGANAIFGPAFEPHLFFLAGAIIGWIIQRIAYRPITPPQRRPAPPS